MAADNHGQCKNCGFDLNGERVFDFFLKEYEGDKVKALAVASMYGCKEGYGRFGKEILTKTYHEDGSKSRVYICPECRKECY